MTATVTRMQDSSGGRYYVVVDPEYPGQDIHLGIDPVPPPPTPPVTPVAIGYYSTNQGPTWDQYLASGFKRRFGVAPGLAHIFVPIVDTTKAPYNEHTNRALFDLAFANDALANEAVPLFTHELRDHTIAAGVPQPQYTLDKWLSGANDAPLIAWLKAAGAWGHRFVYRFFWEMTGPDYTWALNFPGGANTVGKYLDAWRRIVTLVRKYAPLAEVVWCPSVLMPPNAALVPMEDCYPGNNWVNWIGLDGYVTGNVNASGPNRSFYDLFKPSYDRIGTFAPNKGIIICETGVNPAVAATDSVNWLLGIPGALPLLPGIRGGCFFNNQQSVISNEPQFSAVRLAMTSPVMQGKL